MKMTLTQAALEDLRSIRKYTFETWGRQQEELYLGRIWERFETIRADPARCRQRPDLFAECRRGAWRTRPRRPKTVARQDSSGSVSSRNLVKTKAFSPREAIFALLLQEPGKSESS